MGEGIYLCIVINTMKVEVPLRLSIECPLRV